MSYVLDSYEQDYGHGPEDKYTLPNDDLQKIYVSHCQSEVECHTDIIEGQDIVMNLEIDFMDAVNGA